MEAIMISCHIFEISQVSERKTSITLLFIPAKVAPAPPPRICPCSGAKIINNMVMRKKMEEKFGR
jgi:hypothetical protein